MSRGLARKFRGLIPMGVLLAGLMSAAPPGSAGTIGISGSTLIAGAEPGDAAMALTAFVAGTDLVFAGVDFAVVTPGCTADPATVRCALSAFTSLVIIGSSDDDSISLASTDPLPFAITILGGGGDDVLFGSAGDDVMFGGAGDDILIGGGGSDLLDGGPGVNLFPDGENTPGTEPDVSPLPRQSVPAPPGSALLLGALGALAVTRLKRKQP